MRGFDNNGEPLSEWTECDLAETPIETKKAFIREEIRRLQAELNALEEDEKINSPHKQLNLFDQWAHRRCIKQKTLNAILSRVIS